MPSCTIENLMTVFDQIQIEKLSGLRPTAWLCVGLGYGREEVKSHLLEKQKAFLAESVLSIEDLCLKIIRSSVSQPIRKESVLDSLSRQEVLRVIVSDRRILQRIKEIGKLRRKAGFYRKLDKSLQAGRLGSSHEAEADTISNYLEEKSGQNELRRELQLLNIVYESWLENEDLWDKPRLVKEATRLLDSESSLQMPETIYHLHAYEVENAERYFWEALSRSICVIDVKFGSSSETCAAGLERWHTLDDAAEGLADRLSDDDLVLIPDDLAVRRTISRAFNRNQIAIEDPRDPTALRVDEGLKKAILPLALIARGFRRDDVLVYIGAIFHTDRLNLNTWVKEIHASGLREGLESYNLRTLAQLYKHLSELKSIFGEKKTAYELSLVHLEWIRNYCTPKVLSFFESFWQEYIVDLQRSGINNRKAPVLLWLDRVSDRLEQISPVADRIKPRHGVRIDRLGQAPLRKYNKVWIFGLSPRWLDESISDYWFSARDRELLAPEFGIKSKRTDKQERLDVLRQWLSHSSETVFVDAFYDWDGKERENILPLLREAEVDQYIKKTTEFGAHRRWLKSHGVKPGLKSREVNLPNRSKTVIHATELDRMSRCSFQALCACIWKTRDIREADVEMWAEVRGTILHFALNLLVKSRDKEGNFNLTPEQTLSKAIEKFPLTGMIKSRTLQSYAFNRMLKILDAFIEQERSYHARAQAEVYSLEGPEVSRTFGSVLVKGRPDRIDRLDDNLFIIDYKTTSRIANGREMLELGYQLQLPFYALAASNETKLPVIGAQYVQLNKRGARTHGVLFKEFNGKDPGKLTNSRAKSSVFEETPEEIWFKFEPIIQHHAERFKSAIYALDPKKSDECDNCLFGDICGYRRAKVGNEL